ncbi:MAG: nuclear transport factor 2 family protein [Cyanobacteria bacterium P01_D01_bin.14]
MSRSTQLVTDISTTLQRYLHAWNATTPEARATALAQSLTPEVIYVDPHAGELQGIDAVQSLIEQFHAKFNHPLEATGHLDVHHHLFRLPWRLGDRETGVLSHGMFVGEFNDAVQIVRLWTFLDGKQAGD